MDDSRISRLTEAQRSCLRLVGAGFETKEIAIELGISPTAVTERLRVARSVLGVSRSSQAAKILHNSENGTPQAFVHKPFVVVENPSETPSNGSSQTGMTEAIGNPATVQEMQAAYDFVLPDREPDTSLRIPFIGGVRDDLKTWQIICCCVIVAIIAIAIFGLFLKIGHEIDLSREQQRIEQPQARP